MDLADKLHGRLPPDSVLTLLTRAELSDFLGFATIRRPARGEAVISAGDPGDSMMIVVEGTLKICVQSSSGREIILDYLGPGGIIGEIAVFDGKPRTADAIAAEPAELLVLQRRFILPFLERHPTAALRIIEMLCDKLRKTNALVQDGAAVPMGPKLARGVLRLMQDHGVREGGAVSIGFRISQTDLGNYVGLSRENVNRQLREWEEAGLLKISRGRISITDEDSIRKIAVGIDRARSP